MSVLFTPKKFGSLEIKNRFIHSACEDNLAAGDGQVTDENIKKLQKLSRGEVGLIIWSHLAVAQSGRNRKFQAGIYSDEMIDGLKKAVGAVHNEGGKIAFQLGHGGLQASQKTIGQPLMGPSSMSESQIKEIINAFKSASERAVKSGADAIQLHAAHGYLLNEFLSPNINQRKDAWGGSDENRFKLLKEIILEIKSILPQGFPLLIKLSTNDFNGEHGVTPSLSVKYAGWLNALAIDGLEISCGSSMSATFNMCRGDVPVNEMVKSFPEPVQKAMEGYFQAMVGNFVFDDPYNVDAAKRIRPVVGDTPLFAVGGWRDLSQMEEAVSRGDTDFISMCRPFIREPNLIKRFRTGKAEKSTCKSCNKCLAAVPNDLPVRCYYGGFPK